MPPDDAEQRRAQKGLARLGRMTDRAFREDHFAGRRVATCVNSGREKNGSQDRFRFVAPSGLFNALY